MIDNRRTVSVPRLQNLLFKGKEGCMVCSTFVWFLSIGENWVSMYLLKRIGKTTSAYGFIITIRMVLIDAKETAFSAQTKPFPWR